MVARALRAAPCARRAASERRARARLCCRPEFRGRGFRSWRAQLGYAARTAGDQVPVRLRALRLPPATMATTRVRRSPLPPRPRVRWRREAVAPALELEQLQFAHGLAHGLQQ